MQFKAGFKLLLSVCLLLIVIRFADLETLKRTLLSIPLPVALLVIFGYWVGQLISSLKWWLLATSGELRVSYPQVLKAYFIGMFVNCFGLGIVGGDVARGILIGSGSGQKAAALASVVADRTHGLAVLAFIGTVCALALGRHSFEPKLVYILSALGISIVCAWFIGPALLLRFSSGNKFSEKAREIAGVFPKDPSRVALITFVSGVFHLLQISLHAVMAYGLGVTIPLGYLFVAIPFVNIASSLPISWNGLGVRENAYVFFLVPAVLTHEQAIAFGAMWLLAVTVSSAIGGIVAFISKDLALLRPVPICPASK